MTFKNGVRGKGANMISKHDLALSSRLNASKVINFPPEFEMGDPQSIKMRLPNKVFNELKLHSLREESRHNRLNDKHDKATTVMSLDPKTKLILFKVRNNFSINSLKISS
jgi:RIO kinase 3